MTQICPERHQVVKSSIESQPSQSPAQGRQFPYTRIGRQQEEIIEQKSETEREMETEVVFLLRFPEITLIPSCDLLTPRLYL
jgi:hypothetical protein